MPNAPQTDLFGAPITLGTRIVRLAALDELDAVLALRSRAFRGGAEDRDDYDADCLHFWVGKPDGPVQATLRLMRHSDREALLSGYTARYYDLESMAGAPGETLELGRFCSEPGAGDGDLMRLMWAGLARLALATGAARLIGCTSFHATDAVALDPAWALLKARHQGPATLTPGRKAAEIRGFEQVMAPVVPEAASLLPGLLKAYLAMGGWVSDHAVIDRDLGTCHVFTCVEIDRMPPSRKRALSHLAMTSPS